MDSSGNSSNEKQSGPPQRAARFLSSKLSAQSLRSHFRAYYGGAGEAGSARPGKARDQDLHKKYDQGEVEISRPMRASTQWPASTGAFLSADGTGMVRSMSDAPVRRQTSQPLSELGFRSQRALPYGPYGGPTSLYPGGYHSSDIAGLSQGLLLPWDLPPAPLPAPRRKKTSSASSNTSQRDSGGSVRPTTARRPQGGVSASVLTPPMENDAFPDQRNSMQNNELLQKRIQELWGVNAATSLSRADAQRARAQKDDFSPRPVSGRRNATPGQQSFDADDAEEESEIHFVPRGLSGLYSPPTTVEGMGPPLLDAEPSEAADHEQEQARRSSDIERKDDNNGGAFGEQEGSAAQPDRNPEGATQTGMPPPQMYHNAGAVAGVQPPTGGAGAGSSSTQKRLSSGSQKLQQRLSQDSDHGSLRSTTSRPVRGANSSANSAFSIENVDEDDLKAVIDSRGFALDSKPALTKEDRFARALAQRASSPAESASTTKRGASANRIGVPQSDGAKVAQIKAATTAGALRAGGPTMTETTFGPAEVLAEQKEQEAPSGGINAKDRLRRLESMGKSPRSNPFSGDSRRPPLLSEDEERKASDGSGNSGLSDPSATSAVTGPSNTTSSGESSSDGARSKLGSGSGSGSGSLSYGNGFRRIGIGERGAAIDLPGAGIGVSSRRKAVPPAEQSMGARSAKVAPKATEPMAPQAARQGHRKAPSEQSGSSGGRSRNSDNTFGG